MVARTEGVRCADVVRVCKWRQLVAIAKFSCYVVLVPTLTCRSGRVVGSCYVRQIAFIGINKAPWSMTPRPLCMADIERVKWAADCIA